jgi:hypothetical protein
MDNLKKIRELEGHFEFKPSGETTSRCPYLEHKPYIPYICKLIDTSYCNKQIKVGFRNHCKNNYENK